ncbi:MAG: ATP-binding protein [Defluviitaleaceae bacterium]|nr:ATP-binding protein [Defluviitaleaceae bacterium]
MEKRVYPRFIMLIFSSMLFLVGLFSLFFLVLESVWIAAIITLPVAFALSFLLSRYMLTGIIQPEINRQLTIQQKGEKQRREFSANVSHELKTPLTTITVLSDMMAGGMVKPEDTAPFAARIQAQAERLIGIIDEIIYLSEFDEGKAERDFIAFELEPLVKSVIESLEEKAKEKSVAITLEGEASITGNSRLIDELLFNLIDNAIKYNVEGGTVAVTLALGKVTVRDTGIGIAPEHHSRIFERFYRVDKSRAKNTGGTGLGLAITKHIAEHHGGKVTMTSTAGEGTTMTFEF